MRKLPIALCLMASLVSLSSFAGKSEETLKLRTSTVVHKTQKKVEATVKQAWESVLSEMEACGDKECAVVLSLRELVPDLGVEVGYENDAFFAYNSDGAYAVLVLNMLKRELAAYKLEMSMDSSQVQISWNKAVEHAMNLEMSERY